MSSAQMWRWLCNCFKCQHDLNDRAQLWNNYLKFLINFQLWKLIKIQYVLTLGLKITLSLPRNPTRQGFPIILRGQLNFPKNLSFD